MKRKKIIKRTIKKDQITLNNMIDEFKKRIKKINIDDIISIDETHMDLHMSSIYGWCESGKQIVKKHKVDAHRYTMTLGITNKKIIHTVIIKGSSKKDNFVEFIKGLIKKLDKNKTYYLLLDNASIHRSNVFKQLIEDHKNINIIYNVPYMPEYNPIEMVFSKIKYFIRKQENNYNKVNLKNNILNSLKIVTPINLKNYFTHSLKF